MPLKFVLNLKLKSKEKGCYDFMKYIYQLHKNILNFRLNPITKRMEAYVPSKEKAIRVTLTFSTIMFMVKTSIKYLKECNFTVKNKTS